MNREFIWRSYTLKRFGSAEAAKRHPGACIYVLCFSREEAEAVGKRMASLCSTICLLGATDFSPWPAPGIWDSEPLKGGGEQLLRELNTEIIPRAEEAFELHVTRRFLIGYSLAGLLSTVAAYEIPNLAGIGCVSGSLWMEGFEEYYHQHELLNDEMRVYLSVGSKEKNTRNQRMQKVEEAMRLYRDHLHLQYPNGSVQMDINPGTHFTDPEGRIRRSAEWLLTPEQTVPRE